MNTIDNERIQTLVRMLEVNRSLGGVLDLEPYLLTIIAAVTELTGSEVASILEPDEGGKELRFSALPWFHRDALKAVRVPLAGSIAGWVYENAKPLNVPDAAADPRHFKAPDQAAEFQTRSMLAVPLIFKGQTLGVLEAANKTNNAHYTEEDLTILETLASSAAIAIQISRLASQAQRALEEIANLDRMKSDFIAIASHELRTPLGLILGHATFLREIIAGDYRAQLDIIIRNAMRLKEIIESIADIDNVQRGLTSVRRKPFSITSLIAEVLDTFDEEARKKGVTLHADTGQIDPSTGSTQSLEVEGDASKIAIVLGNLVRNAITFTDPGGHIFVVTEWVTGHVKVSVIDDGVGIPAKDLPHIFERFYQVESHLTRKHGGMGLGLAVVKVMVEMHGGRIWAESVEGQGSNFTFLLPLDWTQPPAASTPFTPS